MDKERTIVTLLRDIAEENGYKFETFAYDWVKTLSCGDESMYIYGYNFPVNDTSFTQIANDKACTYEILSANGIPAVEHFYFMSPNDIHYVKYLGVDGNWIRMLELLEKYKKLVIKPNSGTGGEGLKIVSSHEELEKAVTTLFSASNTLCISPYYDIKDEYRVIIFDGIPLLIFKKVRPFVIGNGTDNVAVLCAKQFKKYDLALGSQIEYIPENGEKFEIGWKHNLGQGSTPEILNEGTLFDEVTTLACRALSVLYGKFASVDCVYIDGKFRVLEINSGVMMDNFAGACEENYAKAKTIYKSVIKEYFSSK